MLRKLRPPSTGFNILGQWTESPTSRIMSSLSTSNVNAPSRCSYGPLSAIPGKRSRRPEMRVWSRELAIKSCSDHILKASKLPRASRLLPPYGREGSVSRTISRSASARPCCQMTGISNYINILILYRSPFAAQSIELFDPSHQSQMARGDITMLWCNQISRTFSALAFPVFRSWPTS